MNWNINDIFSKEYTLPVKQDFLFRVCADCSTLMEVANEWLRGNPSYGVWKCETVERRVESSGQVLMESMLFHEATYGFNVSINGIRWAVFTVKQFKV